MAAIRRNWRTWRSTPDGATDTPEPAGPRGRPDRTVELPEVPSDGAAPDDAAPDGTVELPEVPSDGAAPDDAAPDGAVADGAATEVVAAEIVEPVVATPEATAATDGDPAQDVAVVPARKRRRPAKAAVPVPAVAPDVVATTHGQRKGRAPADRVGPVEAVAKQGRADPADPVEPVKAVAKQVPAEPVEPVKGVAKQVPAGRAAPRKSTVDGGGAGKAGQKEPARVRKRTPPARKAAGRRS